MLINERMTMPDSVSPWLSQHVTLLCESYQHWTGQCLLPPEISPAAAVAALHAAPFALVSHGVQPDPVFNYGNQLALDLFEMTWDEFTTLPSRLSAEVGQQDARRQLLAEVSARGYSDNYAGVRIAKSGRRFMIRDATVWNLSDTAGVYRGQAAIVRAWQTLA